MVKKWLKENKVYFEVISSLILTIATTYALFRGIIHQERTYYLQELAYQPEFRIEYGLSDTLNCDNEREELFMVELSNDGYDVDLRYTIIHPYLEVYNGDTSK